MGKSVWFPIAASLLLYAIPAPGSCSGDCNGDGAVTVEEIIRLVDSALGSLPLIDCHCNCDLAESEVCEFGCLLQAVNNLLADCPRSLCGGIAGLQCDAGAVCDYHDSTCSMTDLQGTCVPKPEICPQIFQPVCGCDGRTYSNDCERLRAGVTLGHSGACDAVSTPSPTATPIP